MTELRMALSVVISALLLASLQTFELFEARHSLAQSRALQDASVREVALVKQRYETLANQIAAAGKSKQQAGEEVLWLEKCIGHYQVPADKRSAP